MISEVCLPKSSGVLERDLLWDLLVIFGVGVLYVLTRALSLPFSLNLLSFTCREEWKSYVQFHENVQNRVMLDFTFVPDLECTGCSLGHTHQES